MQTNKKSLVFVVIAVALLIAAIGYTRRAKAPGEQMPSTSVSPSASAKPRTNVPSAAQSPKTYTEYVKEYEGYRIQFNVYCQAVPSSTTFKNGTKVMFDNRSGEARQIKIGDVSYAFPGYGYKILTLTSSTLPKNLLLSCGTAVNVGQILLQK